MWDTILEKHLSVDVQIFYFVNQWLEKCIIFVRIRRRQTRYRNKRINKGVRLNDLLCFDAHAGVIVIDSILKDSTYHNGQ